MWGDYPGYYSRYVIRQKRHRAAAERRSQREQARKASNRFMRKVRAQIRTADQIEVDGIMAWTALSDINHRVAEFFVTEKLIPDEELSLILEARETIYLRAKVVRCHEFDSTNRVISPVKYRYRVRVAFTYESPEEQTLFQDYLAMVAA